MFCSGLVVELEKPMKSEKAYTQSQGLSRITEQGVKAELRRGFPGLRSEKIPELTRYLQILMRWNQTINLIGTKDWKKACRTLILDSLHLSQFLQELPLPPDPLCLDIGAGAGLPGIPLRIVWPDGTYLLVEPRQKRVTFLNYALGLLRLERTSVFSGKVKHLPQVNRTADLILSRAFCPWREFLDLSGELLSGPGLALVFASHQMPVDCNPPFGWIFTRQKQYPVQGASPRFFWVFRKTQPCASGD